MSNITFRLNTNTNVNVISTSGVTGTHSHIDLLVVSYFIRLPAADKCYLKVMNGSNIESKTHKGIDNIFERFKPEAVIVEVPPFEGELGEEILNRCDSERCVEGLYAYQKAKRLGINVIGGEPQHNEVLRVSLKNGL